MTAGRELKLIIKAAWLFCVFFASISFEILMLESDQHSVDTIVGFEEVCGPPQDPWTNSGIEEASIA